MTEIMIEGRRVRVSDDFRTLSPEQQAAAVEEIAAQIGIRPGQGANRPSGAMRPFALFNEGVARIGDAVAGPVGRGVNALLGAVGVPESVRVSEAPTRDLMRLGGVATAQPENWMESFAVGTGEAAGFMVPGTAIARGLSAGTGVTGQVAQTILDALVRTPGRAVAAELMAGGGARMAGDIVRESNPDNQLAQIGAELAGGVIGGLTPYAVLSGPGARAVSAIPGVIARNVAPFTEQGGRQIAAERLRTLSADPERAVARLSDPTISDLTPAQRTGEPGLMALERTIAERSPQMREALDQRAEGATQALRAEIDTLGGDPAAARAYFQAEIDRARQNAVETARRVAPVAQPGQIAAAVRQELEGAYDAARMRESEIWGRIPRTVQVPSDTTYGTLQSLIERTGRARQSDIPPVARAFFEGREGPQPEPWFEMHDLYSALRQYARQEGAGPAPNNARIANANALADSILRDIEAAGTAMPAQRRAAAIAEHIRQAPPITARRPQTFYFRNSIGRVHPDGRFAAELRALGITARNTPGLFSRSGRMDFDNIPAVEHPEIAQQFGSDRGYLSQEGLIEMLRREFAGEARDQESRSAQSQWEEGLRFLEEAPDSQFSDPSDTNIGELTSQAIRFSREMHEAFTQGAVGRILGRTRAGGDTVPAEMALDDALRSGGTRGAVGAQDLRRAAGFNADYRSGEAVQDSISDFLLGRFAQGSIRDGRVNLGAAETFTRNNAELLDQFPLTRQVVGQASEAERAAQAVETSIGAVYASTQEGREFARTVFGPGVTNASAAAASLRRQAAADPTGQAVAGLKGAAVDFIMGAATNPRTGAFSGRAIEETIRQNERALLQILTGPELNRLRRVAFEMNALEQAQRSGTLNSLVDRRPNRVISYILRVIAARSGAAAGQGTSGASLQTAAMASNRMQETLQMLTEGRAAAILQDAITDPDLMRALFEDYGTSRRVQERVQGRMTEWLQGYAATQLSSEN